MDDLRHGCQDPSPQVFPAYTPTDPQFSLKQAWYLSNTSNPALDINVKAIWDEYRGSGITIAIIDDGIEYTHSDLVANVDPSLGGNFVGDGTAAQQDGRAIANGDNHGTLVAGVIAADDNGSLGVGIAPDATIAGLRIAFGALGDPSQILDAFIAAKNFDIANSSWGYNGYFYDNFQTAPFNAIADALIDAVDQGRGGLGTVFTFAAGNSAGDGQDVNYHGFLSSPLTITVGGYNQYDNYYSASTPGAAVLVSGPAQYLLSTDRTGSLGYSGSDTATVAGTSFASPAVAAVIALMLEANPNLGYRDVQEILTLTSEQVDANGGGWQFNGSTNWNGGGQHFSNILGFGSVDAHDAVSLAETWDRQSTYANLATATVAGGVANGALTQNTIVEHLTVGDLGIELDQVVLRLETNHSFIGDLVVTLESPDGTVSTLINRPGNGAGLQSGFPSHYELTSVQYWGEDVAGDWTLTVQDAGPVGSGTLQGWSLTFLGDVDVGDDVYVYTEEWGAYGGDTSRQLLQDDSGVDTINMAGIPDPIVLDLRTGFSSTAQGHSFTIDAGTVIENGVTGSGDDVLTGNSTDNWLRGMRGNDTLAGGQGNDTIDGGAGEDTAVFSGVYTDYSASIDGDGTVLVIDSVGSDGTDTLIGIEFLSFSDQIIAVDGFVMVGEPPTDPPAVDPNQVHAPNPTPPVATVLGTNLGREVLNGTTGNDIIDGGGGQYDELNGGLGDDVYIVSSSATIIRDGVGEGHDTLYSSATFFSVNAEIETLYMMGNAVELRTNVGDNVIHGTDNDNILRGGAGNDELYGYFGNDKLYGDAGNDLLFGGAGTDQAIYKGTSANYNIIFNAHGSVTITALVGDDGEDRLVGIEQAVFQDKTVDLPTGPTSPPPTDPPPTDPPVVDPNQVHAPNPTPPAATVLGTNLGREVLNGTTGDDVIDGGGGKYDELNGGLGDDVYIVSSSATIIRDGVGEGHDTLYSSATFFSVNAEIETLYMIGNAVELRTNVGDNVIHGTDNDNILRGGAGNDELYGYFGNDKLYGDAGNDQLFGGAGTDQAIYKGTSANYQITYNTDGSVNIVDTLGTEGNDHLTGIEQAVFSDRVIDLASTTTPPPPTDPVDPPPNSEGGHAPSITLPAPTILGTSASREVLTGTSGNDVIDGGGGKYDTMQGGLGDDTYIVNNSTAIIKEAAGDGNDTLYSSATFYSSGADIETLYMVGDAKELRGGSGGNVMHGTDGDNIIRGGGGIDQLFGYYGDDTLYGEFGDDLLYGGEGTDTAAYKRDYASYSVVQNGDGSVTVTDNVSSDGTDTLTSIELLSFSDQTIDLSVLFG